MRWLAIALLVACQGSPPASVESDPRGPRCAGETYDLCTEEHDCTSMLCQPFPTQGFQVCSIACGTGCPNDKSGQMGVCDNGVCRPSAANMCHL